MKYPVIKSIVFDNKTIKAIFFKDDLAMIVHAPKNDLYHLNSLVVVTNPSEWHNCFYDESTTERYINIATDLVNKQLEVVELKLQLLKFKPTIKDLNKAWSDFHEQSKLRGLSFSQYFYNTYNYKLDDYQVDDYQAYKLLHSDLHNQTPWVK